MSNYNIHHKDRDPGNNAESNLQILCCKCHRALPKSRRKADMDVIATTFSPEYRRRLLEKAGYHCGICSGLVSDSLSEDSCLRCGREVNTACHPTTEFGFLRLSKGLLLCFECRDAYYAEVFRRIDRGEYIPDALTWRGSTEGIRIPDREKVVPLPCPPGEMRIYGRIG